MESRGSRFNIFQQLGQSGGTVTSFWAQIWRQKSPKSVKNEKMSFSGKSTFSKIPKIRFSLIFSHFFDKKVKKVKKKYEANFSKMVQKWPPWDLIFRKYEATFWVFLTGIKKVVSWEYGEFDQKGHFLSNLNFGLVPPLSLSSGMIVPNGPWDSVGTLGLYGLGGVLDYFENRKVQEVGGQWHFFGGPIRARGSKIE